MPYLYLDFVEKGKSDNAKLTTVLARLYLARGKVLRKQTMAPNRTATGAIHVDGGFWLLGKDGSLYPCRPLPLLTVLSYATLCRPLTRQRDSVLNGSTAKNYSAK